MSRSLDHAERHPQVILLTNDIDDNRGVCELISSQVDAFRALVKPADIYQVLIDSKPPIVLLGYTHVSSCVQTYAELIEKKLFNYRHKTILLCDNKESGIAFKCCSKGLFDDYFVNKPMYENFRLRLILQRMFDTLEGEENINRIREEHFGKIDESLSSLIDQVVVQHEEIKLSFEQTKAQTIKPNDDSLSAEPELYNILREEYLDPLISALEGQLSHNIIEILGRLKSNQQALKHCDAELNNVEKENIENKKQYSEEFLEKEKLKAAAPVKKAAPPVSPPVPVSAKDKKVMVVDDNEIYREMICKVLRDAEYSALGVENGNSAIQILKEDQISAIFMDLFMPGLDGYNTTKNIRTIKGYEKLPIIALTGNTDKEMIKKWAQQGLNGYIVKPATKFAILEALKKSNISPH